MLSAGDVPILRPAHAAWRSGSYYPRMAPPPYPLPSLVDPGPCLPCQAD
eukprot:gene11678-10122_t